MNTIPATSPEPPGLTAAVTRAHLSTETRLALLEHSTETISRQLGDIATSQGKIATEIAEGRRDAKRIQLVITLLVLGGLGFGVYRVEATQAKQAASQHPAQNAATAIGPLLEE